MVKFKDLLKKGIYITLVMVLLTPLTASTNFTDPMLIPKMGYFQFIMGVSLLLLAVRMTVKSSSAKIESSLSGIFLVLFVLWIVIRTLSTPGSTGHNLFMTSWILLTAFYFLTSWILRKEPKGFSWLAYVLLSVASLEAAYGLLQHTGLVTNPYSSFGATGTYINPGPYAIFIAAVLPFSFGLVLGQRVEKRLRYFAIGCTILIVSVLPLTASRTAWVAALSGCAVVLIIHSRNFFARWLNTPFRKVGVLVGILILVGISSWQLYLYKVGSATGRLFIYGRTLEIIQDRPLFGVGFDNFSVAYHGAQAEFFSQNPEVNDQAYHASNIEYAFNEYLQIAVELGLIGLLLFLLFIGLILGSAFRPGVSSKVLPAWGCIMAILVSALFSYPFHEIPVLVLLVFSCAVVCTGEQRKIFQVRLSKSLINLSGLALLVLVGYFLYDKNQYLKAESQWKNAYIHLRQGQIAHGLEEYGQLYPKLRRNKLFLYNYGVELGMAGNFTRSIEILEETKSRLNDADVYFYLGLGYWSAGDLQKAEENLAKAAWIIPYKFIPRYRLMEFYDQTDQIAKAKAQARLIIDLEPKVDSEAVVQIKAEAQRYLESTNNTPHAN